MAENDLKGNYKDTDTYKKADSQTRAKIERYKKENKLENGQMYLLLLREDYRSLPKEEKQKGNRPAEILVVGGIITFLILTSQQRQNLLPYAAIYMIAVSIIYFSGILNPVARKLSNLNKLIRKACPDLPSLSEYLQKETKEEE